MYLTAIGVFARVGHGQKTGSVVPQLEVLILELLAIDALTAGAVMPDWMEWNQFFISLHCKLVFLVLLWPRRIKVRLNLTTHYYIG